MDTEEQRNNDSHETLAELLARVMETTKSSGSDEEIQKLKDAFIRFQKKERFEVGDIVVWKNGLRNREPAIVVENFSVPFYDEGETTGSSYFREPLDIRLGVIDDSGDFITYVYDSRRFESFSSPDKRIHDMLIEVSKQSNQE